jgi:hypothetical protein
METLEFFQSFIVFFKQDLNPGLIDPFAWMLPLDQKAKLENLAKNWLLIGKRFLVSQSDVDEFEN